MSTYDNIIAKCKNNSGAKTLIICGKFCNKYRIANTQIRESELADIRGYSRSLIEFNNGSEINFRQIQESEDYFTREYDYVLVMDSAKEKMEELQLKPTVANGKVKCVKESFTFANQNTEEFDNGN